MSVLNYILSGSKFTKAKNLAAAARLEEGEKADALFKQAYENFASISSSRDQYPDSLHQWGLSLLNQAQKKSGDEAIKTLEQAIVKFNLCDSVKPDHLGAALDSGVALMGLAKAKNLNSTDDLYIKAQASFVKAEEIQQGSASYNLACLYAIQNDEKTCLIYLEKARDNGLVPEEKDILNDADLDNVKKAPWFAEFIASLNADEQPEPTKETEQPKEKEEEKTESTNESE